MYAHISSGLLFSQQSLRSAASLKCQCVPLIAIGY